MSGIGEDFFRSLVVQLAATLRVRYALVAECVEPPPRAPTRVRTLAFWMGAGFGDNFQYALTGTPCADVLGGDCCFYPEDVQCLFPGDGDLRKLGAVSYLGVPLRARSGRILGHLAVIDDRPMLDEAEKRSLLQAIVGRTAAELERHHAERHDAALIRELQDTIRSSRALSGLIPVCAWCRMVRDREGNWQPIEDFVRAETSADFTHGICPACLEEEEAAVGRLPAAVRPERPL